MSSILKSYENGYNSQIFIASANQSRFQITNGGSFMKNKGRITVLIAGVATTAFTEDSNRSIILITPVPVGTIVELLWYEGVMHPVVLEHNQEHEVGGRDEIDITKLSKFDSDVKGRIDSVDTRVGSNTTEIGTLKTSAPIDGSRIPDRTVRGSKIKVAADSDKIGLAELKQEVLQTIAGTSPVGTTPTDGSVTSLKYADGSIEYAKFSAALKGLLTNYLGTIDSRASIPTAALTAKKGDYFVVRTTGKLKILLDLEEVYPGQETIVRYDGTTWKKVVLSTDNAVFTNPHDSRHPTWIIKDPNTTFLKLEVLDKDYAVNNLSTKLLVLGAATRNADGSGALGFYTKTFGVDAKSDEPNRSLWGYETLNIPAAATGILNLVSTKMRVVINWDRIPQGVHSNIYDDFGYTVKTSCIVRDTEDNAYVDTISQALDAKIGTLSGDQQSLQKDTESLGITFDRQQYRDYLYSFGARGGSAYTTSTFSGWSTYVGSPSIWDTIRIPIKNRVGNPNMKKVRVILRKGNAPNGVILYDHIHEVDIAPGVVLDMMIPHEYSNESLEPIYLTYQCDQFCDLQTAGVITPPGLGLDLPYYYTNGNLTSNLSQPGGSNLIFCEFSHEVTTYSVRADTIDKFIQNNSTALSKVLVGTWDYTTVFSLAGARVPVTDYASSTFTGWKSYIGKPGEFNSLKLEVQNRDTVPMSRVNVALRKGSAVNAEVLFLGVVDLEEHILPGTWKVVTIKLPQTISAGGSEVYAAINFGKLVTFKWTSAEDSILRPFSWSSTTELSESGYMEASGSPSLKTLAVELGTSVETVELSPELVDSILDSVPTVDDVYNKLVSDGDLLTMTEIYDNIVTDGKTLPEKAVFDSSFERKELLEVLVKSVGNPVKNYTTSTFSGWGSTILPKPTEIKVIKFKVASRAVAISQVKVFLTVKNKAGVVLREAIINTPTALPNSDLEVVWVLDQPIVGNTEHIYFTFEANQVCDVYLVPGVSTAGIDYGILAYATTGTFHVTPAGLSDVSGGISSSYIYTELCEKVVAYLPTPRFIKAMSAVQTTVNDNIRVVVPDKFVAVVGDTLQLFYRGIVEAVDPYRFDIRVLSVKGKTFPRYWEYKPLTGEEGEYTIAFEVWNDSGLLVTTVTTKLVVVAPKSPSVPVNVLCVGDSLTSAGAWVLEAARRLTGTGGTPAGHGLTGINFIGTKKSGTVGWEGYGGWTWNSYLAKPSITTLDVWFYVTSHNKTAADQHSIWQDASGNQWKLETMETTRIKFTRVAAHTGTPPSSGSLTHVSNATSTSSITFTSIQYADGNPFWDVAQDKVDLATYCSRNGFSGIDYVYTLLTWNGGRSDLDTIEDNQSVIDSAKSLIDKIHTAYPNAKIRVMGIQLPSLNGGTGANYGASGGYSNAYGLVRGVFGMNLAYQKFANDPLYKDFVEFIGTSAQFDSEYMMPETVKVVNTRSLVTERMGTNGVHPSGEGYSMLGDISYRNMIKDFQI